MAAAYAHNAEVARRIAARTYFTGRLGDLVMGNSGDDSDQVAGFLRDGRIGEALQPVSRLEQGSARSYMVGARKSDPVEFTAVSGSLGGTFFKRWFRCVAGGFHHARIPQAARRNYSGHGLWAGMETGSSPNAGSTFAVCSKRLPYASYRRRSRWSIWSTHIPAPIGRWWCSCLPFLQKSCPGRGSRAA